MYCSVISRSLVKMSTWNFHLVRVTSQKRAYHWWRLTYENLGGLVHRVSWFVTCAFGTLLLFMWCIFQLYRNVSGTFMFAFLTLSRFSKDWEKLNEFFMLVIFENFWVFVKYCTKLVRSKFVISCNESSCQAILVIFGKSCSL